jgi:methyl-accepting chemotaxis protein
MKIRQLFMLLPAAILAALSGNMALQWYQGQSQAALTQSVSHAQTSAATTTLAMQSCSELTPLAVAWTLTRRAAHGKQFAEARQACLDRLGQLAKGRSDNTIENEVRKLVGVLEDIQSTHSDDTKLLTVGRLEREARPLSQRVHALLQGRQTAAQHAITAAMGELAQQQRLSLMTALGTGLLVLSMTVAMLLRVQQKVMSGIEQSVELAQQLATGDLRVRDVRSRQDEFDQLSQAMNIMKKAWVETVREVQGAGALIMQFSHTLRDGGASIQQGNAQATESLLQANAAMYSIRMEAHRSTDAAAVAESQALQANEQARKGGAAVADIVDTIQSIASASHEISEIIGVIDGIAFQTNILALNAAVEAARAGPAGAGFAVVAAEVRALAQRSGAAASDVRSLIGASAEHVRSGVEGTSCAKSEILGVASAIDATSEQIQSVAAATREQSVALDQITATVESIGQAMQSSSSLVSDWAECSDALESEAVKLHHLAARFQLP